MIGRFAYLGSYRGLFRLREFLPCLAGGGLALAGYLVGRAGGPSPLVLGLGLAGVAVNGAPIVIGAVRGLLTRQVNVDELVSLAIVASLAQGEVFTAATVSFIMTLGSLVEAAVGDGARRSIAALAELAPQEAVVLDADGGERVVSVADIRPGDRVLVRPGERIPVDALIAAGRTAVDESAITGESLPRERGPGDAILAGTLNYTGRIEATAVTMGEDTTFAKVVRLVTEAEAGKPRAARVVDRYAGWFTPLVLACAGAAWLVGGDLDRAVAVLVAGCPCALIMAAPTATVAAVGLAARRGLLVKGGQYLEEAGRAQVVLFDKTGTLTRGRPEVATVAPAPGRSPQDVLGAAAAVERDAGHPLALAIRQAADRAGIAAGAAASLTVALGLGVRGEVEGRLVEVGSPEMGGGEASLPQALRPTLEAVREAGATALVVRRDGEVLGLLGVADMVRPGAAGAVAGLRRLGIATVGIVSGDHARAVSAMAGQAGIDDVWAGLKPAGKLEVLARFQDQGRRVLFVGDGVNDAPGLARAHVGVAMGGAGTAVALETADVALTNDDLGRLPFLVYLGRRMTRLIAVNIALGLTFNAVAILAGAWGLLGPVGAAVFHNVGSVVVVLSSASLAFTREPAAPSPAPA